MYRTLPAWLFSAAVWRRWRGPIRLRAARWFSALRRDEWFASFAALPRHRRGANAPFALLRHFVLPLPQRALHAATRKRDAHRCRASVVYIFWRRGLAVRRAAAAILPANGSCYLQASLLCRQAFRRSIWVCSAATLLRERRVGAILRACCALLTPATLA